jgi:hypothetical protein
VDAELSPFVFRVVHIRGSKNVVADCLSRVFEASDPPADYLAVRLLQSDPASFETLKDHQKKGPICHDLYQRIRYEGSSRQEWLIHRRLVVFRPKWAKRPRVLVPKALRPMILHYFYDSPLGAHLGSMKNILRTARISICPVRRRKSEIVSVNA